MKLQEALQQTKTVQKHVDGEVPGTYTVSKANISAGYYKDFKADDPARRSPVATAVYYGWDYPGDDPLASISSFAGDDGWQPR